VAASAWQKDAADAALVYSKDLLMVVVAVSLVDSFRRLRILTWVVLLSVGYLAFDMNVSYYSGWNRLHENGFAGIDNNGMAMLLAMGVPVSLAMGNYEKNWKMKALAWAWIPFEVNSVFFAFSRSAMLGMALAGVVLVWLMPKSRLKPVLLVLGLIGGLALAGNEVRDRFSTTFKEREELDTSAMSRYDTWSAAWSCIMDHPLLGLGPRCFNKVSRQYGLSDGKSVHNLFLQVGADSGIAAAASLLGMFVTAIIIMIRRRKPAAEAHPWFPHWTAMITAGLVSCLVSSQFIGMEQISLPYFFIGLGMMAIRLAAKRFPDAQTVGGGKTHDHRRPTGASISAPRASEGL